MCVSNKTQKMVSLYDIPFDITNMQSYAGIHRKCVKVCKNADVL